MALFEQHVQQAKHNLLFLQDVNDKSNYFDWQVTTCFYVAVHLINAHLAKCANQHYKTHVETKQAINPNNRLSLCKIDESIFNYYVSLEKLSRRSRYLCNEGNDQDDTRAYLTCEKHVSRAMSRLNTIMGFFNIQYKTPFQVIKVSCPKVKSELPKKLDYFVLS